MIVRDLAEARKTERLVKSEGWDSTRLLLKSDNVGFSFHITTLYAGGENHFHYKNHYESVYVVVASRRGATSRTAMWLNARPTRHTHPRHCPERDP